ncbi:TonB-dependent receptor domain-containing protein [Gynurincola endophyticus]|jgi:iron complex outermembrane receptor protein|uniref:TonB-dependent receptor domain-containing protein n=1 Tax=Gynurincola endophyticus TaxID=2479004 RepID=UPI000F8F78F8|nr:TonB-dependent receptor [Gynurincola endophyticus]
MKSIIITVITVLFMSLGVNAQTIEGKIESLNGEALSDVNVTLKKQEDSSTVKIAITGTNGRYKFEQISSGKYFVEASMVGYKQPNRVPVVVNGKDLVDVETIYLESAADQMQTVVVKATRPPLQAKADKLIMNVEGTINSVGEDAIELLRKAPSVNVDKDDNITMSGKSGVQVYIDGKRTPMNGKDLANYLKSIPSSSIDQIEIINNPSAKYDAAGTAGIINIKLKKNSAYGTTGTANAGWGVGRAYRYNGGVSLNHRNNNWNLFSNVNYYNNRNPQTQDIDRFIGDSAFIQVGRSRWEGDGTSFKVGADYTIDKNNIIGVMVDGNYSSGTWSSRSTTEIMNVNDKVTRAILEASNANRDKSDRMNYNLNYRYSDTTGRSLNFDGDYSTNNIRQNQTQPNRYLDPINNTTIYENNYFFNQPNTIDMSSLKLDYEQNFWKGKLGVGAKYTGVETNNTFDKYDVGQHGNVFDSSRSNFFKYNEDIAAAYVNFQRPITQKWSLQAGLRMENTKTKGKSEGYKDDGTRFVDYDSSFTRSYTDFFPSAALTYVLNPSNIFTADYSRRIQRPVYQDLNPFEFYLDEYTYNKGNTNLRPQYTNNFGLTHIYKGRLVTKLSYSKVNDVFINLVDTLGSKAYLIRQNLASQETWSVNVSYSQTWGIYTAIANFNGFNSRFRADYGAGREVDNSTTAFTVWTQHSFRLPKGFNAEISGYYGSKAIWEGMFVQNPMSQINFGVSKSLFKDRGSLKFSFNDIYRGMYFKGSSSFSGQTMRINNTWESRTFRVNFSYRFGNTKVKTSTRKTGLEDEAQRIKSNG